MYGLKRIITFSLSVCLVLTMTACSSKTSNPDATQATATQSASEVTLGANKPVEKDVSENIHVDQIGYKSADKKIAIINGKFDSFELVETDTNKVVLNKKLNGKVKDDASGDSVCYADFSEIKSEGKYFISVAGLGKSYDFRIGNNDLYTGVADSMLKALYYQRCGITLDSKFAGKYIHGACHKSLAKIYGDDKKEIDVSGGWHDAGDYGRYVVPAAVTAADLMLAYELYPNSFTDNNNIPESSNKIPDILDEAKYGIEWMLKMQDQLTGGVHHKVTAMGFPDLSVMPDIDVDDMYVMPVSTTATANFAAVTAMAARIYKDIDAGFAQSCLNASKKAWAWLEKNTNFINYLNPSDVLTGEYADESANDERVWAAAELLRTTGEKKYNDYFVKNFDTYGLGLGWQNVSGFSAIAYMFCDPDKVDVKKCEEIKKSWIEKADMFVDTAKKDGYLLAMHKMEYIWGSNMNVTNHAKHLLVAYKLNNNKAYVEAVENAAHYLMGRNTLSQCYITGFGSKQVMQPHHRPSIGDSEKEPVPGLVVGGPNSALEDDISKKKLDGLAPAKCYIDDMSSYSTNEVATYWNSSAIFVFGFLDQER